MLGDAIVGSPEWVAHFVASRAVGWLALLALCAAYIQGGIDKIIDFPGAIAEFEKFGVSPAAPFAVATIITEFAGSILVLTGFYRWVGALWLAGFTLISTFIANRFWKMPMQGRLATENGFFEHLGLVGGFILVAWVDLGGASGIVASGFSAIRP